MELYVMTQIHDYPAPRLYAVIPHPVTGDPYITGNLQAALRDFDGIIVASAQSGVFTFRGWLAQTLPGDDPDSIATGDFDEALRLMLGTLMEPIEEATR